MKPVSVHHYFRPLKTFFWWCVEMGLLQDNPMRGITVRVPRSLPRVPEDDDVGRLIQACPQTFEGRRNRALIALLADSA
jgi:site-specific recombinase XerD